MLAAMDMTDKTIADNIAAKAVLRKAHELNLAILAAANRGLLVTMEVTEQDLEDDSPTETGVAPAVEVIVDKA
jgi:hypothetical protein